MFCSLKKNHGDDLPLLSDPHPSFLKQRSQAVGSHLYDMAACFQDCSSPGL